MVDLSLDIVNKNAQQTCAHLSLSLLLSGLDS